MADQAEQDIFSRRMLGLERQVLPDSLLRLDRLLAAREDWGKVSFTRKLAHEIMQISDLHLRHLPEGIKIVAGLVLASGRAANPEIANSTGPMAARLLEACEHVNRSMLTATNVTIRGLIEYAEAVSGGVSGRLDEMERHLLVTALYETSDFAPDFIKTKGMTTAFNIASGAAYPQEAEVFEDDQLVNVKQALEKDAFIRAEKEKWPLYAANPDMYETQIMALARRVATVYAEVVGICGAADKILPYRISKEDCVGEMEKRDRCKANYPLAVFFGSGVGTAAISLYRGLPVTLKSTIGINLHRDALSRYEDDYYVFESLVIHEQTHCHEAALMKTLASDSKDPRAKMVDGFRAYDVLRASWHNDHDYGWEFYRVTPRERHAFATQRKIYALRTGAPLPTEKQTVIRDMVMREQGHKKEGLKYKFSAAATPEALRAAYPEVPDNDRHDKIKLSAFLSLK